MWKPIRPFIFSIALAISIAACIPYGIAATGDVTLIGPQYGVINTESYGSLESAVAALGSSPATLRYSTDQTLTGNIVIPANIELEPRHYAVISHGAYTISYLGPTSRFPLVQIFDGTGLVSYGADTRTINAEWYGENTTPGTTDMLDALEKAVASAGTWNGVLVPIRSYAISDTLLVKNKTIRIEGNGWGQDPSTNSLSGSYLKWVGAAGSPMLQIENCQGVKVAGFRLIGDSSAKPSSAILFRQTTGEGNDYNTFERLYIGAASWNSGSDYDYQFTTGITLSTDGTGGNDSNKWDMIKINLCNTGIDITNSQHLLQHFSNLYIWYATVAGIRTKANISGNNWFFALNAVDIETYDSSELPVIDIQSFNSESSGRMLRLDAGGTVHIHGGYWQARNVYINDDHMFIKGVNSLHHVVILEDFDLTRYSGYSEETPTISLRATPGNAARNVLKLMGATAGIEPANIDMNPVAGADNEAYIVYEHYGAGVGNPMSFIVNHLGPGETLDSGSQQTYDDFKINKALRYKITTLTTGDATPTVANGSFFATAGSTAITDFTDGTGGQIIHIVATGNITITNGSNILLAGATNFSMTAWDTLTLISYDDPAVRWVELSRSVN